MNVIVKVKEFLRWVLVFALLMLSVFGLSVVSASRSLAGEVAVLEGESAITFTPVSEKAGRLVEIELVSSAKYPARYKRLELAVFKNDWRPLGFANDGQPNPGKCIVTVLLDSYTIDCWLVYPDKKSDTFQIKVPDPDMVVGMVIHFSRKLAE